MLEAETRADLPSRKRFMSSWPMRIVRRRLKNSIRGYFALLNVRNVAQSSHLQDGQDFKQGKPIRYGARRTPTTAVALWKACVLHPGLLDIFSTAAVLSLVASVRWNLWPVLMIYLQYQVWSGKLRSSAAAWRLL